MFNHWPKINWAFWVPVSAGIVIVSYYLIIPSWQNIRDEMGASSWPSTAGRVVTSKIIKGSSQQRITRIYQFRYQFVVQGKQYQGERYSFRFASGDRSAAVKRFSSGDEIKVYYDPNDPSQCVIERGLSAWWNYVVLISMIVIPIALIMRFRIVAASQGKEQ